MLTKINLNSECKEAFAAILLCLLFYMAIPFCLVHFFPQTAQWLDGFKWIVTVPLFGISLILYFYTGKFYLNVDDFKGVDYGRISLLGFLMLIVCGLSSAGWIKLLELLNIQYNKNVPAEEFIRSCNDYELIAAWIFVCIMTPFFEEIIFRRVIYNGIREKLPPITAVTVTSVLFAALHGVLFQLFPLFLLGVYFQYLYLRENKLGASIYAHFFNNTLAFGALLLVKYCGI